MSTTLGVFNAHLAIRSTYEYAYSSVVNPRLDGYTIVSGRLSLSLPNFSQGLGSVQVSLWGGNILDEEYVVLGYPIGVPAVTSVQAFGQPRTFGVDARFLF